MQGIIVPPSGKSTTTWLYSQDVTDFANELRTVEGISLGTGSVVQYPLKLSMIEEVNPCLFVRHRVKILWEKVLEDCDRLPHSTRSIVTGNPGIGKTRSMAYLLRLLLQRGEIVFYDDREYSKVYVFVPRRYILVVMQVRIMLFMRQQIFQGKTRFSRQTLKSPEHLFI
jgi:hypothetical protein